MQRLSRKEVRDLKRALGSWQTPDATARLIEPIRSDVFFNQAGLEFLRDASLASELGRLRKASAVRLITDTWPDFELRFANAIERFEAVEALDPSRRRGDEYRNLDKSPQLVPGEKWIADAEAAPGWVAEVCQKKANKRYADRAHLLIYLNFGEFGIRQREVRAALPGATAIVKDQFDSVWVLWQRNTLRIWKAGKPG